MATNLHIISQDYQFVEKIMNGKYLYIYIYIFLWDFQTHCKCMNLLPFKNLFY